MPLTTMSSSSQACGCIQDVVCASERRSSDRLSGMEGGQALHSSGLYAYMYACLLKPLVRQSRTEHSLSHIGENSWQQCGTHRGKGLRQWPWVLFVCIAWPAVTFIMISQVPSLELTKQWTEPKAQSLQWMFANSDKSEARAAAAR